MSKLRSTPNILSVSDGSNGLRTIALEEASRHQSADDCWLIIYDKVYDVTGFLKQHPGGEDLLLEHAGRDGTVAFRGANHTDIAMESLKEFLLGELPLDQRLFRKPDGYKLSNIPE